VFDLQVKGWNMKFITNLVNVDDKIYKNIVCFHQLKKLDVKHKIKIQFKQNYMDLRNEEFNNEKEELNNFII
jgi:hypothetical protein